jgi:translocation and assembly module TamB
MLRAEKLGDADLRGGLVAPRGATVLSPDTRIDGALAARSPSLAAVGGVMNLAALVDGTAQLELALGGTLGALQFSGQLAGDALRLDLPASGIAIRDGRLRARVEPTALRVDELTFSGKEGAFRAEGAVALDGAPSQRVLNRPDRQLTVSGEGTATLADGRAALRGALRVDRGHFDVPRTSSEPLGSDVVVAGRERGPARKLDPTLLDLDVALDAGNDLTVRGIGIDTTLDGKLRVRSFPDGHLEARGKINAVHGTYRAFGQNLEIERGELLFDGPLDDPALDVLAFRRNLPVEAGVELTGTLRLPLARLVSRPAVPDSEKLSWLVLGHGVADASASDLGLLQTAATTVLSGSEATPIGQRIARGVGLDELAIRGSGTELTTQAVAVGKRITRDLYVEYEYGLAVASHLVRLQYTLTRTFSLRAETSGETSSAGVTYRKSWD